MVKDTAVKKRKASAPEAEIEKVKKVKQSAPVVPEVQAKKRKAAEEAAPAAVKKSKTPKSAEDAFAPKSKATKKTRSTETTEEDIVPKSISKASKKKASASKPTSKRTKETIPSDFVESEEDEEVEPTDLDGTDSEVDDQTEALLKGFESEGDEQEESGEGLEEGQPVPKVPKLSKAEQKLLKAKNDDADDKPGVVYVGRIPHGFYEYEMKEYFKQFGTILKLRLSRNRKTGASRHYAFIQFESATVADIVARTMDNYLLFGHILKVKAVADEQLSPLIWKGANKRFKKVPWNKLEGRRLKQGASEEDWEKRVDREKQRRADKQKKLEGMGYEFEQPALKSAKGIAAKAAVTNGETEVKATENGDAVEAIEEPKTIEAAPEPSKKKEKKVKAAKVTETIIEEVEIAPTEATKPKRTKKQKTEEAAVVETPAEVPVKQLRSKRSKTTLTEATVVAEDVAEKTKGKRGQKAKAS